jgi:hypothetical protein
MPAVCLEEVTMRRAVVLSSIVIAAAVGCSATPTGITFTGSSSGSPGGTGGSTGGTGGHTGLGGGFSSGSGTGNSTGSGQPGCTMAAELVYVLSTDNHLWSFEPGKKQFIDIGVLGCNVQAGAQPNSMAVDRNADAWVNYVTSNGLGTDTAGWVYKVSTKDASCEATPTFTLPSASWYRLGMGFSTDAVGGTAETLYVAGTGMVGSSNSPGLGKLNFTTKSLVPINQFTGDPLLTGQSAELTGTGDARLFGFFTTSPVRVAQMDKSAKILSDMPVNGVPTPMAWAFSFWGGAFYLYTSDGISQSTVTRFDPTTKSVDTSYVLTAPTVIDGAGVSTCAPLQPTT